MLFHEKRLTGLFMTEHPTSRYRELLKGVKFKTIASLDARNTESSSAILCTVNASRKKFTRSGKPFFQLQVEDDSGAMEVPLFEDNAGNPNNLKFGQILVLLIEYRKPRFGQRDAAPKLAVKTAVSLDEFIAQSTKLIKLKVNSTRLCGETFADALTQLLAGADPGYARIRITYQNQQAQADILLRKFRIAANLALLEKLQSLSHHKIEITADINALHLDDDYSSMLPPPAVMDSVADVH